MPYVRRAKAAPAPVKRAPRKYVRKTYAPKVSGQGAYRLTGMYPRAAYTYDKPGPVGALGRTAGKMIGRAVAGPVGGWAGEKIGGLAHYIGKIFGSGDYVSSSAVKSNSILSPQVPQFGSGQATIRIRHREYLGDILSSATANTFNIQSYAINPGLSATFPWLSQVSDSTFQQYRLNGLVFEYRTMSSDALNSVNTALGSVVMCTDYDSADANFTSKAQMENTEFGVSCKPSCNMIHAIECAPRLTTVPEKYVRAFAPAANTDIRLYDMGKFYIATTGVQGTNVNLGELWCSYDITFMKAIDQVPGYSTQQAEYILNTGSPSAPLGTPVIETSVDTIGLTFISANKVTFPLTMTVGSTYMINLAYVATSTSAITHPVITCGGGMLGSPDYDISSPPSTTVTGSWQFSWVIRYTGGGTLAIPPFLNVANFTWGVAGIAEAQLYMTQVSGSFGNTYTLTTA